MGAGHLFSSAKAVLKRLYTAVPFKQELFTVVRGVVRVPEVVYRHLHFVGVFKVQVDEHTSFLIKHHGYLIENELFWRGMKSWDPVSLELWKRLCPHARVVMDIGANTGLYALVAQAVNPAATVIAVEPVERVFGKLAGNVALNGGRIKAIRAAVSDRSGMAILYDSPDSEHVLSVSLDPTWNSESTRLRPVEVPSITVQDLLKAYGSTKADLLKIDVETHEPAVLDGCGSLIREHRPTLLVELLNDEVAARVAAHVDGLGYEYYDIDERTWPPPRVAKLGKSGHWNFLICQPGIARTIGL